MRLRPRHRRPLPAGLAPLLAALLLGALATLPAAAARDVEVRAALEPEDVAPGQVAFFSIEVRGGVFDRVGFEPHFELVNLEQVGSPSTSNSVRWINGATSRSVRITWRLRAQRLGPAAVRNLSVEVGGERYDLPAETLRVVSDPPPVQRRRPQGGGGPARPSWNVPDFMQDFFERRQRRENLERPEIRLIAEAVPRQPWAGQQVTYTLWLYTQTNIARVNIKEMPELRGFWVEELERTGSGQPEPVELDGERFWRTPLLQRALFPRRPGRYTVDPAEIYLVANLSPSSPFAAGFQAEQVVRSSEPLVLDVRPLPPVPADLESAWSGLVGQLDLDARLVPSELAVGEAATLELTLTGRGNVEGLAAPLPPAPEGVEVMPPEASGGNLLEGERVAAERTWSYPLVPQRAGTWRLPPVELAYFDPAAGEYRLASSPPLLLRARRGEARTAAAGAPALHPVKNAALPVEERTSWRHALPWLFGAPWALVLVVALVRWRRDGGEEDPALARFLERLEARHGASSDGGRERPRHVALAVEAAWSDFLAERFDVPPGAPPSRWREHLERHGTDPRLGEVLDDLVEDLHYLRHAPQLSTIADLADDLRRRSQRLGRALAA